MVFEIIGLGEDRIHLFRDFVSHGADKMTEISQSIGHMINFVPRVGDHIMDNNGRRWHE